MPSGRPTSAPHSNSSFDLDLITDDGFHIGATHELRIDLGRAHVAGRCAVVTKPLTSS